MDSVIPVITGATATGKTALGIALARGRGGAIVSMDSRQVYRGMDIGTAKPRLEERCGVPHYGFDVVDPDERYSAGRFARDARSWIREIRDAGRVPILVGGTGFFLRALTHPLFEEPALPAARRRALDAWLASRPREELERWARTLDPGSLSVRDRQRLCRRIEMALLTGRSLSWWYTQADPEPPLPLRVFVLELPRADLYHRIDRRVHDMIAAGLVDEVRNLAQSGWHADHPGMSATGYAEILEYLSGTTTLDEAVTRVQAATRRYARRQHTWLRHQLPEEAVRLDATRGTDAMVREILETVGAQEANV